jgi:glycosyltransferase involved in cell wall biosynthesis
MLEAFSAGVPVVAFDVGGIPEVIKDEDTGFLASEATVGALSKRIAEAIADTDRLVGVAQRARTAWESRYTIDHYRRGIMLELDRVMGLSQEESEIASRRRYK